MFFLIKLSELVWLLVGNTLKKSVLTWNKYDTNDNEGITCVDDADHWRH